MDKPSLEESADGAILFLSECIKLEKRLVHEEHALEDVVMGLHNVMGHIEDLTPDGQPKLNSVTQKITQILWDLLELLNYGERAGLKLVKEQKSVITQLESDLQHRNWRAIEDDMPDNRLEIAHLKQMHNHFKELMKAIRRSHIKKVVDDAIKNPKVKEEYEDQVHHYLVQIYRFARSYERIFRHLMKKERLLKKM